MLGFSIAFSRRSVISAAFLVEVRVHAGDDNIHLLEHAVGEIERAVGQDVDFDAGENRDAVRTCLPASRMRWMCSTARLSSSPLAKARFFEWSVMAMYL